MINQNMNRSEILFMLYLFSKLKTYFSISKIKIFVLDFLSGTIHPFAISYSYFYVFTVYTEMTQIDEN